MHQRHVNFAIKLSSDEKGPQLAENANVSGLALAYNIDVSEDVFDHQLKNLSPGRYRPTQNISKALSPKFKTVQKQMRKSWIYFKPGQKNMS